MRRVLEWSVRILIKWLQCLYELLCLGPLILLLGVALTPEAYLRMWFAYPAAGYLLGLLLGLSLKRSRVWLRLLLAFALGIVPALFLFPPENWAPMITILGIIAVYRGSTLTHISWEEHYPLPVSWIGLGLYFVFSYLFTQGRVLLPYLSYLGLMGIVFIVTTVFALNHRAMKKAVPSQGGGIPLPRRMIRQNRWLIALFAVVVLLIGLFREIKEAVAAAAVAAGRWLMGVMEALYGRMRQVPLEGGGMQMPMLPENGTANPFWETVLTILLYIVAGAVSLFILACLFLVLWKGLKRIFRGLRELLGRRSQVSSEGYIDKRESLWDMGRMARRTLTRTQRWLRTAFTPRERWSDMRDNRQRVRFLYRRYIRRAMDAGFQPDPAATAAETIAVAQDYIGSQPGPLFRLYAAVRYGEAQPSDEEIAAVKNALDQRTGS